MFKEPEILWTRLAGGAGFDTALGVTTGTDGSIYVTGRTDSPNLDSQINSGDFDAFITRYNSNGSKAWAQIGNSSA